jgi:hypothetical protein
MIATLAGELINRHPRTRSSVISGRMASGRESREP